MDGIRIKNWERWQSYRKDRGQPPWIKIHRRLMRNVEWVSLSDAERGQLVGIWLLGADHDGVIPASPEIVQKLCFMSDIPDLNKFTDLGFLENGWRHNDVNLTSGRRQHVTPKAEAEAEADIESTNVLSCPQQKIVDMYHQILPMLPKVKKWNETRRAKLASRWKEDPKRQTLEWWEGYFKHVGKSPKLTGSGNIDWIPDLEWLVTKSKLIRVCEGYYH